MSSLLNDVCIHITDGEHGTVIDTPNGDYYLLSNKNIVSGEIVINDDDRTIDKEWFEKINKRINLEEDDVLISTVGTIGKVAIVKSPLNYAIQRSIGVIKTDKSKLNPYYLYYQLQTPQFQKRLISLSKGAVQKCLFISDLKALSVSVPSLAEQNRIADFFKNIDKKIQNNKKQIETLENLAKTIYDYWFVQFDFPNEEGKPYKSSGGKMVWNKELKREIPEGWNYTILGKISECLDYKRIPLSKEERNQKIGVYPYYGATEVMGYVNEYIFDGDFVLMAEDGSIMDKNEHPILQRIRGKTWINNHTHVLKPSNNYSCCILMLMLKDVYVPAIKTGSIQAKITQENMNKIKLIDIPFPILSKINSILQPIENKILNIKDENKVLEIINSNLLPLLMNGQVSIR